MTSVRARLLLGFALPAVAVLVALDTGVGLTPVGWLLALGFDAATLGLFARALTRQGARGPRPADLVTLGRAALVGGVAGLVASSFMRPISLPVLISVAAVALALDAVDGKVARHTGTQWELGARFDMEVDALLILVLSAYVARSLGAWVLLIGLARYLLLLAGYIWPWLRWPTPPRPWAKVVAATQGIVLTVVAADVLAPPIALLVTAAALALLVESFAHQVAWLVRARPRRSEPVSGSAVLRRGLTLGLTVLAVIVVWLALALPDRFDRLTPGTFVQIPAEGLVLTAAALLLPGRPRTVFAAGFGSALGVIVLLKALDIGFYSELYRGFNPILDWSSFGPGFGVLRDSVGSVWAYVAAAGAVLLAVAVVALAAWASLRLARRSAAHRRGTAWVVGVLAVGWLLSAIMGLDIVAQTPVASRSTTDFAVAEVRTVASGARDVHRFADQLAAPDPYGASPAADLLSGLRGKDVIVAFVESYGQTAVQGSAFAPGVVSVLDQGTQDLAAVGFSARSGFITSPTFGGVSWLAHSTLQSGLWIDSKQRYEQLLDSDRLTLSAAFGKAGWRTISDAPANKGPWPEGAAFYGFDQQYDATNTGYEGPRFSYATMPDQYSLAAFQRLELTPGHAPVMAELDLVSSHTPWAPLPRLVDWNEIGDGSVYDPMPAEGQSVAALFKDDDQLRAAYGRSIQYSLQSLVSFVQHVDDDNLVLVLLGDHQPSPTVSGPNATHDVPITIVARDPAVMDRISSWGWSPGLRPAVDAPVWPMDAFRNRFLDAFS